jgi:hypothetical protein
MSDDQENSKEIERWIAKNGPQLGSKTLAALNEMALEIVMDDSGSTATYDIMEAILDAGATGDLDAIFAAANAGTTAGKDMVDRAHYLRREDIQWKMSAVGMKTPGGFPVYVLARATDLQTGERVTMNCGGHTYVLTLYTLIKAGVFDRFGEEGMPMVIRGKQIDEVRTVLIPQLYVLPKVKVVKGETTRP